MVWHNRPTMGLLKRENVAFDKDTSFNIRFMHLQERKETQQMF